MRPIALFGFALLVAALGAADVLPPPPDDAGIRKRVASAGDHETHKSDTVVVFDHTDVTVRPDGIGAARRHRVVKLLTEAGVRSHSVERFDFDPHTNRLDVQRAAIHRRGGGVETIDVSGLAPLPAPQSSIFWGAQRYLVSMPCLQVGDAIETVSVLTGFNVAYLGEATEPSGAARNARGEVLEPPVPGHWHDEVHWWSAAPTLEKRYSVRISKDQPLQYEIYNGELKSAVLFDGDEAVYVFEKRDVSPFKGEPDMEPAANVAPKLLLATMATWEEKSRWLHAVSEPTFEPDDAIRAKVAELVAGKQTDLEKWTALNSWVAENIRYVGTSRGMCEGYTAHDIRETFHDRAGVCKDKAGMLVGMLRVAGYEAYLVMTMARQRVDRVPADQFNHAVTAVRDASGQLVLLDPTWMPKSRDNWSTLEPEQHVVYGVPDGLGLLTSPSIPPEQNAAEWRGESTLEEDGSIRGSFSFRGVGAPETRLRRALAGAAPADRGSIYLASLQRLSSAVRVEARDARDPVDFSGPVDVRATFAAPAYAIDAGGPRLLRLPLMQTPLADRVLSDVLDKSGPKERKYGLRLWTTRRADISETVRLPAGWRVLAPPAAVKIEKPAASLTFELRTDGDAVHYTCRLDVKRWTVPADEYAGFREVMKKFAELGGPIAVGPSEDAHASR